MKHENIIPLLLGFVTFILVIIGTSVLNNNLKKKVNIDLPEEYSQANDNDTLIAIKKGNTLYIQFNRLTKYNK